MDFDERASVIEADAAEDNVFAFARRTRDSERVIVRVEPLAGAARQSTGSAFRAGQLGRGAERPTSTD